MVSEIRNDVTRVVILDISGIYAKIHNDGYFPKDIISEIENQYRDALRWRVIVI